MRYIIFATVLGSALALCAAAQPSVNNNGVVNAASYALPGLPNSSIAQGSMFIIFGTGLGSSTQATSFPLPTQLGGTSVKVTVNGTSADAPMVYAFPTQVAAIMPSTVPVGSGTITVTFNGATSASRPVNVVANSFGIFTLNQAGTGGGIITNANFQVLGPTNSLKPGEAGIIWGTGLGPVSYSDAIQSKVEDMTNVPVEVFVGGKKATVLYRGRSGFAAEDQINFLVPSGVTEGCNVSVAVKINNTVSNIVTMPLSSSSNRVCSDSNGISSTDLQTLLGKGTFSIGAVSLARTAINITAPGLGTIKSTTDVGSAVFSSFTPSTFAGSIAGLQQASVGSCTVITFSGNSTAALTPGTSTGLDAGPAINVKGPNGTKQLTPPSGTTQKGVYFATLSSGNPVTGGTLFLDPGSYTIDNGAGGADVKGFTVNMTVPQALTWNELNTIGNTPISRAQGLTVTWTGGEPGTFATITGVSVTNTTPAVSAAFTCIAPVEAKSFFVGPDVLLQLPPSAVVSGGGVSVPTSFLSVGNSGAPVKFTAPGLDFGLATFTVANGAGVTFQ